MKEILINGDPTNEFQRLEIHPTLTYQGKKYKVYKLNDLDFEKLYNDDAKEKESWLNSTWSWCKGSVLGTPTEIIKVNGEDLIGWRSSSIKENNYRNLLTYFCDELGVSRMRNICACAIELAKHNNMTLAELFIKYQG